MHVFDHRALGVAACHGAHKAASLKLGEIEIQVLNRALVDGHKTDIGGSRAVHRVQTRNRLVVSIDPAGKGYVVAVCPANGIPVVSVAVAGIDIGGQNKGAVHIVRNMQQARLGINGVVITLMVQLHVYGLGGGHGRAVRGIHRKLRADIGGKTVGETGHAVAGKVIAVKDGIVGIVLQIESEFPGAFFVVGIIVGQLERDRAVVRIRDILVARIGLYGMPLLIARIGGGWRLVGIDLGEADDRGHGDGVRAVLAHGGVGRIHADDALAVPHLIGPEPIGSRGSRSYSERYPTYSEKRRRAAPHRQVPSSPP